MVSAVCPASKGHDVICADKSESIVEKINVVCVKSTVVPTTTDSIVQKVLEQSSGNIDSAEILECVKLDKRIFPRINGNLIKRGFRG